ncbi:Uncharacterised protein [Klebsiella pneumoniae]|nr:Uncharacterised protein [Klebsiella pneumoniae]
MHPRLSVICSAPLPVCTRALAALKCFARGQRNFSRVKPHAYPEKEAREVRTGDTVTI